MSFRHAMFAVTIAALFLSQGFAQSPPGPDYVRLGSANGAVYHPAGAAPHVGFVVMHRVADFMHHPACGALSARGFMVLCIDPTAVNNEAIVTWDQTMLDVAAGVEYLRKQPGISKVLLFGHSGGGTVMGSYQAVAEKGLSYCQAPQRLTQCSDKLAHLPPADGVVFADAHPNDGVQKMRDIDPAVVADKDGSIQVRPDLDPFSTANGYGPVRSHYSKEFIKRYAEAQAAQMANLIEQARRQAADMKQNGMTRANEDLILIPTTKSSAWILRYDPNIEGARETVRPEKLLRNDGSIVMEKVTSVAVATGPKDTKTLETLSYNADAFLQSHTIRGTNSIDGIDYCSSNSSSICGAQFISVPAMVAGMGGYMFVRDSERLYDHLATKDKDLVIIEGALHTFTPCKACEKTPGHYDNSEKNLFDYIRDWTQKHFPQ
jgi:hypothetical protein